MHLSTSTSASCVCCHLCGQHGWLFSWHSSLFWLHTLYSMSLFAVMHMLDLVHLFVVLYDKTGCFVANLSWFVFRHFEHTVAVLTANHWIELADVLGGCAVPFLRMMIGCWSKPCRNPQRLCWSICIWKKKWHYCTWVYERTLEWFSTSKSTQKWWYPWRRLQESDWTITSSCFTAHPFLVLWVLWDLGLGLLGLLDLCFKPLHRA